jgi:hypothetical protein
MKSRFGLLLLASTMALGMPNARAQQVENGGLHGTLVVRT